MHKMTAWFEGIISNRPGMEPRLTQTKEGRDCFIVNIGVEDGLKEKVKRKDGSLRNAFISVQCIWFDEIAKSCALHMISGRRIAVEGPLTFGPRIGKNSNKEDVAYANPKCFVRNHLYLDTPRRIQAVNILTDLRESGFISEDQQAKFQEGLTSFYASAGKEGITNQKDAGDTSDNKPRF